MMQQLHAEDRQAIGETLALHGHIFDRGQLDRLGEIFTPEVVYDLSDVGVGTFEGIEAIRSGALKLGAGEPRGSSRDERRHHQPGGRPGHRTVQGPHDHGRRDLRKRDAP